MKIEEPEEMSCLSNNDICKTKMLPLARYLVNKHNM